MMIGIWKPRTMQEVWRMKHVAGLYMAGTMEIHDTEQLDRLLNDGLELVVLEQDTHAVPLGMFSHPIGEDVLYLAGPTLGSIPRHIRDRGRIIQVETGSRFPLEPAVAMGIVLHDRYVTEKETVK